MQFARRVADIVGSSSAIMTSYSNCQCISGIDAVGYHGKLDVPSRHEAYMKWKSTVIVATKAFINKPDIRHIVRSGVPKKRTFCHGFKSLGEQVGSANNLRLQF